MSDHGPCNCDHARELTAVLCKVLSASNPLIEHEPDELARARQRAQHALDKWTDRGVAPMRDLSANRWSPEPTTQESLFDNPDVEVRITGPNVDPATLAKLRQVLADSVPHVVRVNRCGDCPFLSEMGPPTESWWGCTHPESPRHRGAQVLYLTRVVDFCPLRQRHALVMLDKSEPEDETA